MTPLLLDIGRMVLYGVLILVGVLLSVLIMILVLRRFLGKLQNRIGPNRTGFDKIPAIRGYGQTAADALKLFLKEDVIPTLADKISFILAPSIVFLPAYLVYVVIPFGPGMVAANLNVGILYISAITSVAVIGFITAGWASNNKYSLLGGLRSAAQIVSYEVPLVLTMIAPVILAGSLRLTDIVAWQKNVWFILITPVLALSYITAGLAEVNLTPFDMVEAESELVAGFNTEYSGMKFALFFLAEFANTFTTAAIMVSLYLGGWHLIPFPTGPIHINQIIETSFAAKPIGFVIFMTKAWAIVVFTMWIRGTLPRIRVDQLMEFGWKFLIPLTLVSVLLNALAMCLPVPRPLALAGLAVINWGALIILFAVGARKVVPQASSWAKEPANAAIPQRSRV